MTEPLSALDTAFLELEDADPAVHMHIGLTMLFAAAPGRDGAPAFEDLLAHVAARVEGLPLYRCRLSSPRVGRLRRPEWVPAATWDVAHHVRRASLPAPGGEPELWEWLGDFFSHRLDRSRPLWEMVVLEGLAEGRWAIATKTHHCLVDGVASSAVVEALLDPAPVPAEPAAGGGPGVAERVTGTLGAAIGALRHPRATVAAVEGALNAVEGALEIVAREGLQPAPATSINGPLGGSRAFRSVRLSFPELSGIAHELGGTVNDVLLAATAGALRALLLARGEEPPRGLRAMVPVDLRHGETTALGNRVGSLYPRLAVEEPDRLARYLATTGAAEAAKAGPEAAGSDLLVGLSALAPPALHALVVGTASAESLFNVTVTNVPGPRRRLSALGAPLERILPVVPLAAGHGLGVAALSYAGGLEVGLVSDADRLPELDLVAAALAEEVAELAALAEARAAARGHEAVPRPAGADAAPATAEEPAA